MKRRRTDELDGLLSARLKKAVAGDGRVDWSDVCERAGVVDARAFWSRGRILVFASVLVLAVGACAGSTRVITGGIPWIDKKPAKPKSTKLRSAVVCPGADLRANLSLVGGPGPVAFAGQIDVKNVGRQYCLLPARPRVSFVGAAAQVTRWRIIRASNISGTDLPASPSRIVIDPGKRLRIQMQWWNWCGPGTGPTKTTGKPPTGIQLGLYGAVKFTLPLHGITPRCNQSQSPSVLLVSAFEPPDRQPPMSEDVQSVQDLVPTNVQGLVPTIIAKGPTIQRKGLNSYANGLKGFIIHRGETFRYEVALKTTWGIPFRFSSCPSYVEALTNGGKFEYILNCRPVWRIRPGRPVRFEMEFAVPRQARLGWGILSWTLGPKTVGSPGQPEVEQAVYVER